MKTIDNNLRVATYHWEYNGDNPELETRYHVGIIDRERIEQYCKKYSIKPLFTLVEQSPQSPYDYENRPVLKELFELVENEQIDLVLINRMFIFEGSFRGFHRIVWKLKNHNVAVRCVDEPFSVHMNDGRLIICPEEEY